MLQAKFQDHRTSDSGKEVFKAFYHIWAWCLSWSCNLGHLYKLSFPIPKKTPRANGPENAHRTPYTTWSSDTFECFLTMQTMIGPVPMLNTRLQGNRPFDFEEKIFKDFYYIWAYWQSWSYDPDTCTLKFNHSSPNPLPKWMCPHLIGI